MTPTTWNPSRTQSDSALSAGNKVVTKNSNNSSWSGGWTASTNPVPTDKVYWEVLFTSGGANNDVMPGLVALNAAVNYVGSDAAGWGYYGASGVSYHSGSPTAYGNSFAPNDRIGFAFDPVGGKLFVSKNGTWQGGGDPVAGTLPIHSGMTGVLFPAVSAYRTTEVFTCAFAAADLVYSPPTGYVAFDLGTPFVYPEATLLPSLVNIFDQVAVLTPKFGTQPPLVKVGNMDFYSGIYKVSGTVREAGSPDVPVQRLVRLYRKQDGMFLQAVWSNLDGTYEFNRLKLDTYYVTSHDHTGNFNAVVKDSITSAA